MSMLIMPCYTMLYYNIPYYNAMPYSLLALIRRVFNPPLALIRRFCGRYAFLGLYNYHVEKSCIKTGGKVKSFRRGLTW